MNIGALLKVNDILGTSGMPSDEDELKRIGKLIRLIATKASRQPKKEIFVHLYPLRIEYDPTTYEVDENELKDVCFAGAFQNGFRYAKLTKPGTIEINGLERGWNGDEAVLRVITLIARSARRDA